MAVVTNPSIDAKTRGIILHIVEQIKSQGVFDRFRRECLEELDSKEPYRQLKQRVESHVATFLSKQVCSSSLPKNQLRASLRTNISQSEVLSKGVDRLLEQVLQEKSASFYNEIEGLVHHYLSSIGHYNRLEGSYKYTRQQRAGTECAKLFSSTSSTAVPEGEKNISNAKLSDKEIDDFIKEETTRFLEATAEEKIKDKMTTLTHGLASSIEEPFPGSKDNVTEVETDASVQENEKDETEEPDSSVIIESSSKPADDISTASQEVLKEGNDISAEVVLELPSESEKSSEETTDSSKGDEKRESENCSSDGNKPITNQGYGSEIMKDVENKMAEKRAKEVSPNAVPNLKPTSMSTDEETDDNGDYGITIANFSDNKSEEVNLKVSELDSELSDSITVSSVHTSDLSSLEDSLSDLEFEDFKAMSKETMMTKSIVTKGSCVEDTDTSDALVGSSVENNIVTSDADDETAMADSDFGYTKPGNPKVESSQTSSQQEDKGLDYFTEGEKEPHPQRRSARVASKDRINVDESDTVQNVTTKEPAHVRRTEESRRVRRKRREIIEEKKQQMAGYSREDVDEMSNERPHQREQRITSDSNESEDVKQSKRSRRTIRPTRCYSPSDNN